MYSVNLLQIQIDMHFLAWLCFAVVLCGGHVQPDLSTLISCHWVISNEPEKQRMSVNKSKLKKNNKSEISMS